MTVLVIIVIALLCASSQLIFRGNFTPQSMHFLLLLALALFCLYIEYFLVNSLHLVNGILDLLVGICSCLIIITI